MVVLGSKLRAQLEQGSSISLPSGKTEERDHTASKLAFAFFIAGELAGQTEWIPVLASQVHKGPHDFFLFSLQDSVCNGANTDTAWQEGHKLWKQLDRIRGPWDNAHW